MLVLGPRASGKTTTARRLAGTIIELDDPAQAAAFRANASVALSAAFERRGPGAGPVLLDEWQEVPELLAAVKRAVDRGARPGSFLLTGSVRARLTAQGWGASARTLKSRSPPR